MKLTTAACILISLCATGVACSPLVDEPATTPPRESAEVTTQKTNDQPPLITAMPPQPPGPPAQSVETVPQPTFRMPKIDGDRMSFVEARAKANFFVMDMRSPIINGNFERWEKPGPIHWDGNFTYKNPGDPPEIDIQMYPSLFDGEWALRFMPKGTYIEIWQDVKVPDLEGNIVLNATAYAMNPVPAGFAIRITYLAGDVPKVAEIYPAQADQKWTRYHARIELPSNVIRESIRLYLTRDASIDKNVIVEGVSVQVIGVAAKPAS